MQRAGCVQVRGNAAMRRVPVLLVMLFCLFLIYLHSFPLAFPYLAFFAWSTPPPLWPPPQPFSPFAHPPPPPCAPPLPPLA